MDNMNAQTGFYENKRSIKSQKSIMMARVFIKTYLQLNTKSMP